MKTISTRLVLLVPALALFAMIACTAPAAQEPEPAAPSSAPEAMATRAPAIPPPPLADFSEQRASIDEAWNQVHDDFDRWRADLTMCHPTAMTEALGEFAIEFNSVTEAARGLTRTKTTGEFTNKLITAAEAEETAFRQLRDRWQPGNVSLFENVEQQRNLASQAQRGAKDMALELRAALEETADPEEIAAFTEAFEAITKDWEEVHAEYDKLGDGADDAEVSDVIDGLKALTKKMEAIAAAVDELPSLKGGKDAIKALEKAAQAEVDAFSAAAESSTGEEEKEETEGEDKDEDAAKLPDFKDIDASVKTSEEALEALSDVLDDLSVEDTADALADITLFELEYDRLLQTWDRFHSDYNAWRGDDGGCDRLEVLESLTEFSANVDAVGDSVRSLPKSGYLEPVHRLLAEAIEGEEQAFRSLRDTWQPFTLDALRAVDRARITSDTRRSDADIIIAELENRF
ncbi:MAG: hypothetical protein OXL37_16365 [Chloroflexota bacterium]|nr:hypothetical protein [Chloroflexota bacterium]MDE2960159.1 hypothetical protein [Chloroflexota bacterium]